MVDALPFGWYHSVHVRCWSVLEHDFLCDHALHEDGFGRGVLLTYRLRQQLIGRQLNLLAHQVHNPDLQLVLAVLGLFQFAQMHETLLVLVLSRVALKLALELKNRVLVAAVVRFPLELYCVHKAKIYNDGCELIMNFC